MGIGKRKFAPDQVLSVPVVYGTYVPFESSMYKTGIHVVPVLPGEPLPMVVNRAIPPTHDQFMRAVMEMVYNKEINLGAPKGVLSSDRTSRVFRDFWPLCDRRDLG